MLASVAKDVHALHHVLERLTTEDLQVLGSFPSQPHALIYAIVACTHCLLLSCSAKHDNAPLQLLPWSLLRLELLTQPNQVLAKILKRMHQMQFARKQKKPLVGSQIRFVIRQLEPFHRQAAVHNNTIESTSSGGDWISRTGGFPSILTMYTRISTIGATLAAWVYLSLHYATASPSPRQMMQPSMGQPLAPIVRSIQAAALASRETRQSVRRGMKIGSHYFFFQANHHEDESSKPTYNVFRIDVVSRHGSRPMSSAWLPYWKPFCAISGLSESVDLSRLPLEAFKALALQLAFHDDGFNALPPYSPSKLSIERRPISLQTVAPLVMKCAIVAPVTKTERLELLGIGSIVVCDKTTLLELRSRLEMVGLAKDTAAKGNRNTSMGFLYRGALLAPSSERFIPAATLMPFALICVVSNKETPAKPYRKLASLAWNFHREVTQSLGNAGLPDHIPAVDSSPTAGLPQITMYPLDQAVDSKTAVLVAGFFVNWTAFERFQQLQDSSIVLQLKPAPAKKIKPKVEETPIEDVPDNKASAFPHRVRIALLAPMP